MSFFAKLEAAARRNDTLLCVGLDPTPAACPAQYHPAASAAQELSDRQEDGLCDGAAEMEPRRH